MTKVSLAEIVHKIDRLPELPQAAMRVSRLLEEEGISAEKLAEVIRVDAGLTTQMLKLCNSAAYGFNRKISTVKEAVAILGFTTLRSMVYTILAKASMSRAVPGYGMKEGDLWYNSLICAFYAKHIAQKLRLPDPEQAFTAGLLRDIGKLIMGEYVGLNYAELEQVALRERVDFLDAEERVIGFNHCIAGSRVAEKWNLPALLTLVIKHHHKPGKLPPLVSPLDAKIIGIVHLSDALTRMIGQGTGSDGMMYCIDIEALGRVGIAINGPYIETLISELVDLHPLIKDLADSMNA